MDTEMPDECQKWQLLAIKVACGMHINTAADVLGIPSRTAYRYSALPEFRAEVGRLRTEMSERAVGVLSAACTTACEVLTQILGETHEPKDRLAAARLILSNVAPLAEHAELRARLDKLERGE